MSRFMLALLVGLIASQLAACNTVAGIGKDIKKGGEAIEGVGKK